MREQKYWLPIGNQQIIIVTYKMKETGLFICDLHALSIFYVCANSSLNTRQTFFFVTNVFIFVC